MADAYIDYSEMEIYGNHTVIALAQIESLNVGVASLKKKLEEKTNAVKSAKGAKRDTREGGGEKRTDRDVVQARMVRSLRSLKSHLDSVNNDEDAPDIDLELFFEGGGLGDLSNSSPAQALLKAEFALAGFAKSGDFPLKAEKVEKLTKLAKELEASIQEASGVRPDEAGSATELQKAGDAWRREYRGLKWIIWGLLIQASRENEYSSYFKDETVGSRPNSPEAVTPSVPK